MTRIVAQPQDKYVLRLPDGMRDRLKAAAEEAGRSMNAEIVKRLEESFGSLPSASDLAAFVERDARYADWIEPIRAELRKDQPDIRRVVDFLDFVDLDVVSDIRDWKRLAGE